MSDINEPKAIFYRKGEKGIEAKEFGRPEVEFAQGDRGGWIVKKAPQGWADSPAKCK